MTRNHPYLNFPNYTKWKNAISNTPIGAIDPSQGIKTFTLDKNADIATMGSCFAQHLSGNLEKYGYKLLIAERQRNAELKLDNGIGLFSARYGNVYTLRQANQLFDRAFGQFVKGEIWTNQNGKFLDSFRPSAVPEGFASLEELEAEKEVHLQDVRYVFENADIFVLTLGLTEGWWNQNTRQVFPIVPGVIGGSFIAEKHKSFNTKILDTIDELDSFVTKLQSINPNIKIILTVSPVPLASTHSSSHVLTANCNSKSILRVAAQEISEKNSQVYYFPSYEIINQLAQISGYYESNLRDVKPMGVDHVMRIFNKCFGIDSTYNESIQNEKNSINRTILCDENQIYLDS